MEKRWINKKLIVLDVDGVIFKGHFLLKLSRFVGLFDYLQALFLCILFNFGRLSIDQFLKKVYKTFKGLRIDDVYNTCKDIEIIKNAKDSILALRQRGFCVAVISSGVPDFLTNELGKRLCADYSFGLEGCVHNGYLTGEADGILALPHGKARVIETLLAKEDISWNDVVIVADDCNNLEIIKKAGLGIGINAGYAIRQQAKYLIDNGDLREVVDIVDREYLSTPPSFILNLREDVRRSWKQELQRKLIHISSAAVPLLALFDLRATLFLLIITTIIFSISELLRLNGKPLHLINYIMQASIRAEEKRRFAYGPITLSAGVIISLITFPHPVAFASIWTIAFADSASSLVGKLIGRHELLYNKKKTVEGSLAFLTIAFLCIYMHFPIQLSLIAALIASAIESLPIRSSDNLLVPLATCLVLTLCKL